MELLDLAHLQEMGDVMKQARQVAESQAEALRGETEQSSSAKRTKSAKTKRSKKEEKRISRIEVVRSYLEHNYDGGRALRYDLLSRKVQVLEEGRWRAITDRDYCSIACHCAEIEGDNISVQDVHVVLGSDFVPDIHPIRAWLEQLPPFLGDSDPIDDLAKEVTVEGDQELWRRSFKRWVVGMVRNWLKDKDVNQYILALVGKQGKFKTRWLDRLMPPELMDYQTKMTIGTEIGKDDRLRIAEFGLINLDEIDSLGRREMNALKSLTTSSDVNERAAYGHTKERRPRCASFCGSGNNEALLSDDTGNRRWWIFKVLDISPNPWLTDLNYEAVYSQAVYLAQTDFVHWVEQDEQQLMEEHTDAFRTKPIEEEMLPRLFAPATANSAEAKFMTATEIREIIRTHADSDNAMPLGRFGALLKKFGFERRATTGGKKGYLVVQLNNSDLMKEEALEVQNELREQAALTENEPKEDREDREDSLF